MDTVVKSLPFHLQIYEILKNKILNGEIKSGERIYENKISQELGVSRSPVREALRILEQDELVISNSGGLIVNPIRFSEMEEVYQCRMAVEPFAAKLAAEKVDKQDIAILQDLVNQAMTFHQHKQFKEVIQCNTQFHDLIIERCGNKRLIGIIQKISSLIILSRREEFQYYQRDNAYLKEHRAVLEALSNRNGDEAENLLRKHIMNDFVFYTKEYKRVP